MGAIYPLVRNVVRSRRLASASFQPDCVVPCSSVEGRAQGTLRGKDRAALCPAVAVGGVGAPTLLTEEQLALRFHYSALLSTGAGPGVLSSVRTLMPKL